jgi:hypothetical protein
VVSVLDCSPARQRRARGRIEHTLLDEGRGVLPNRPKTFARNLTIPHKSYRCSYLRQRAGTPRTPSCQERFSKIGPNRGSVGAAAKKRPEPVGPRPSIVLWLAVQGISYPHSIT